MFSSCSNRLGRNGSCWRSFVLQLFYIFQYHGLHKAYPKKSRWSVLIPPRSPSRHGCSGCRKGLSCCQSSEMFPALRFRDKEKIIVGTVHSTANEPTQTSLANWFLHCVFELSAGRIKGGKYEYTLHSAHIVTRGRW